MKTRRLDSGKEGNTGKARTTHPGESHLAEEFGRNSCPLALATSTATTAEQAPLVRVDTAILMSKTDQNDHFWATETVQKPR